MTRSNPRRAGNRGNDPPKIRACPAPLWNGCRVHSRGADIHKEPSLGGSHCSPSLSPGMWWPRVTHRRCPSPSPGEGMSLSPEFFSPGALLSPQLISHARSSCPCWGQILSLASKAKNTGEKMLKEGFIPESFPPFPCTSSIPLRLLFFVLFSKLQFPALTLWKRGFAKAFGRLHLLCGFPRTRPQGKQDSSNSYIIKRSAAFLLR